jgi:hypothetical protein
MSLLLRFRPRKSRPRKTGRKTTAAAIISLIREMNRVNPLWGAVVGKNSIPSENGGLPSHFPESSAA